MSFLSPLNISNFPSFNVPLYSIVPMNFSVILKFSPSNDQVILYSAPSRRLTPVPSSFNSTENSSSVFLPSSPTNLVYSPF